MAARAAVFMVMVATCMWCCWPRVHRLDNPYPRGCCRCDHRCESFLCFPMLHIHAREAHAPCIVLEPIEKVEA
jgi:hypothetical protein